MRKHWTARAALSGVAGRFQAFAAVWVFAGAFGPCADQAPTGAAPGAAHASASAQGQPAASPETPPRPNQRTPTTRTYMLSHYADTVGMRRALVAGQLGEFQSAAKAVAEDEWTPKLRGDYRPYVDAVRATARSAQAASSIVAGAAELGKLGEACASCHLKFGGPGSPVAPEQLNEATEPSMLAHAIATDRLWEGLVLPSDLSWTSGMQGLIEAPRLDSDVADVAAAARHLRDLARKGVTADVARRGQLFGDVLVTCAGCHERVGVSVAHLSSQH